MSDTVDTSTAITAAAIATMSEQLLHVDQLVSDSDRIDQIDVLERLMSGCAAAQAIVVYELEASIRAARAADGVPAKKRGLGISSQVALACREGTKRGDTKRGFARTVIEEMPYLFAQLQTGDLNHWRATLLVRETACLDVADRRRIDKELCANPATLSGAGDRQLVAKVAALANEYDAAAVVRRHARAVNERYVSVRPAPESMGWITMLLPMTKAVSIYASLRKEATTRIGNGTAGDASFSQLQADIAVERLIGLTVDQHVPLAVNITLSDKTLLGDSEESAWVENYGPVPAGVARRLIAETVEADTKVELRRLYSHPGTGALTGMESTARFFSKGLARFIDLRDRSCRTPWCDAPIRHRDHVVSAEKGGKTNADNGAGLCAACNLAKEAEGWSAVVVTDDPSGRHTTEVTTPTGHTYRSVAPEAPTPDHDFGDTGHEHGDVAA